MNCCALSRVRCGSAADTLFGSGVLLSSWLGAGRCLTSAFELRGSADAKALAARRLGCVCACCPFGTWFKESSGDRLLSVRIAKELPHWA